NSLKVAAANGLKTVSFPSISTGAYGYPVEDAAVIALDAVYKFLKDYPEIELVRFCLFGSRAYEIFRAALEGLEK
ncbi:macro domain-containing protein, partial [bacterium]|nr:macro domain-containing protein [bacterium]